MKIHKNLFLLSISIICFFNHSHSQVVLNWKTISTENKHIAGINTGWDYGVIYGLNYGFKVKTKFPLLFSSTISIPSGIEIFDDLKTKIGLQSDLFQYKNFHFSSSLHGIYRQYSNPLVSMKNIGAELSCVIGYYKPKWFIGTEFTFDNTITTHFKHSQLFKDNVYSDVKDGWYVATGGNFMYGLQTGLSLKKYDITFKIGKVISQNFDITPFIPFYAYLGCNYRFSSKITTTTHKL